MSVDFIGSLSALAAGFTGQLGKVFLSYIRDLGFPTKIGKFDLATILDDSEASVDERLLKIDQARQNLTEALSAIEELGSQAGRQKAELEILTAAIAQAANEKAAATNELTTIRTLSNLDTQAVQRAFAIPTRSQRWFERGFSFCLGIVASLIASFVFDWWR
ncbi:hypothetical protein RFM68_00950 [Mesorhizobium sp. MSK_1335]|uniref:Coil containing protein n=1 Tax=Mesorhizobium montanum TaxID=3072323 RepID=A0ABU4ZFA2_9HYPH|nr:hypothetical protein [Mesorhizobium sp. MSK_1335]MDX8523059.1 hypothetical protein [Mesorhizobium sp. MSK_1335]